MSLFTTHFKNYETLDDGYPKCSVHRCESIASNLCTHCNDRFCSDHSDEHEYQCNESMPYLTETINKLAVRLSSFQPSCVKQFDRWREEARQSIDRFCERKHHELFENKLEHLQKELDGLLEKLNEENNSSIYRRIHHELQIIEIKLIELEHMKLTIRPLVIDEHFISPQHLFPLPSAHHIIHLKSGNESAIGNSDQHLLVEREGKQLCLIDRNLTIENEIPFNYNDVHCICWSSTINRFIIITFNAIFTLDEDTMNLEECSISSTVDWWRGACSDNHLYLSTAEWGSAIYQFDLETPFQLIQTLQTPISCDEHEIICDLKYNNDFLAMPIFHKQEEKTRLDLRSASTLDCIWSIQLHGRCRCCSINGDQWLVMDHDDRQFFHISADGKLLKTHKYDYHQRLEDITTWEPNNIVILTKKTINLHKIQ